MGKYLKNLIPVIRRFKLAATLNILGLSIAFAAFMVIMIQLDYDYGFDKFHKDYDKIFRVEFVDGTSAQTVISRPLAERFFESSPHIVVGALTNPYSWNSFFHVENDDGVRNSFSESYRRVTPEYPEVFGFDFVEGDRDALKAPDNVIIPLSIARKLFGNQSAIGRQLIYSRSNQTVGAVYRDFPKNTIVGNHIYASIGDENKGEWGNWNYHVYIRVNEAENVSQLFENFKRNFDSQSAPDWFSWDDEEDDDNDDDDDDYSSHLRFTSLPDIHYVTDATFDPTPKASRQMLLILFSIAIAIIVIAAINFTNFSMALAPMRIKSVNTRLVMGAQRSNMRLMFVFEAVFFCLLSYFVATGLILLFKITPLASLIDADLSLSAHGLIVGGTALVALIAGFLAGIYPAFYMTSFEPALALKGSFGLSPKGKQLRNTLIGIQFLASYALIIGALFMYLQNHFMQNSPLGYDKDQLITVNIGRIEEKQEAFTNQIKLHSGIEDVTFGEMLLSSSDQYMGWGMMYKGEGINFQCLPVDYTFLEVMGIEITEGRNFRREDTNKENCTYIFNETARQKYNMEINTSLDGWQQGEIIGFISDIKFASFRMEVEPMAFIVWGTENWGRQPDQAYIKVKAGADIRSAISHIRSTLKEFDAEFPFEVRFYDEVLQRLYEKEVATSSLITLFSLIAIFISIVGVFGLVVFESQYRRKEIAIRKVHGATSIGIVVMFNKAYLRILAVCFVIAAPVAWYAVNRWLQNFAYKTPMYWWVFLLAFVAVAAITICTVTFQNWRVANDDPVNVIKSE